MCAVHGSTDSPRADKLLREAQDHLAFCIPEFREMNMAPALERALLPEDGQTPRYLYALAIACARHETQYSRLFRS